MCGNHNRNRCCGRRERRQPLLAQAVIAGYSAYTKHKEQRALANAPANAYPDTLAAVDAPYRDAPALPAHADAKTLYTERYEKAPTPVSSLGGRAPSSSSRAVRGEVNDAPPAYEEVAATRQVQPQPQYPSHPAQSSRPKLRRASSSASSVSSVSSVWSADEDKGTPLDSHGAPVLPLHLLNKKALRAGRKPLRRALKHARSMGDARRAMLEGMAALFGVEATQAFEGREVDANAAVLLAEWARRSAKSRVRAGDLVEAGRMGDVAWLVAERSRKVRFGRG